MTHIINKNISVARARPTPEPGAIRAWIADAIGAVCLFGIGYGLLLIGFWMGF